ncbi:MAG TPA: penicillin-insensitive murein endopeptidase [Polyangiaceae bacterium]|nr:penicillin-insensitive murein endopeptidase [Polyangiaceae bacterium]
MRDWVQLASLARRVLPAACVLAATVVAAHHAFSRVTPSAPPVPAPSAAPARPAAPAPLAAPAPSHIELETLDIRPTPNPLRGLGPAELNRLALTKPASLGTVCVGRPNRGQLFNAVELESEPGLRVMVSHETSFGTAETVRTLRTAAAELHALYPRAPDVNVGDLSHARGGYLRPHHSHQLGVDADVGYFYEPGGKWYTRATAENLDRELTWALVKSLIAQGSVEYIFMDRSVQALLERYALDHGEDPAWLATVFESPSHRATPIRHAWGHITHFHVRFIDPAAERLGRELEARLNPSQRNGAAKSHGNAFVKHRSVAAP